MPEASIVIPTRDRADRVGAAVRAVLASDTNGFEIVVVDQSAGDDTRQALAELEHEQRLRYLSVPGSGSAAARNIGIGAASGEIIGLTDDDCEVSPDWVRELTAAFADERVGVVFGNVIPAPHDGAAGFIPAHVREQPVVARSVNEVSRVDGMAACMGLRKSVWESLGGFDPMLGSGAPLRSGAEGDLALRALANGYFVSSAPRVHVLHHGFRTWEDGRRLIHSYWFGSGATLAKPLKRGELAILPVLARLSRRWAVGRSPVAASLGSRPYRWFRLAAFLRGFGTGMRTSIDGDHGHYRSRGDTSRRG
jgi:glycosyltransferase involved in cell wall biosynthesis